ncbi:glycoside hydrolase family 2 TIM barrel-domain containing protein [Actinomadura scrupuli]|uniref:glycoside hydrolase family 2 TIM barrel-domain containing protein n=1 Tax=Actinomadura scrupuli TaxID=559629 RepID=UPI003D957E79
MLRKVTAVAAVLACVTGLSPARAGGGQGATGTVEVAGGGSSQDFDRAWKFALVNPDGITDPAGAHARASQPGYDDSAWRSLDLPHDWSIELTPTPTGNTDSGTGFLQGGLGWYRKTFTLPPSMAGKRISVEFDGVYMDSSIYFNGHLLAHHPYGYTGFEVGLTELARTDGKTPNVLAVKVRNRLPSSRWYSGSGIYRHVHLVVTDPVHTARHGVFVTTPGLESTYAEGYANVRVRTSVADDAGGTRPVAVVSTVRGPDGRIVASHRSTATAGAEPAVDDIRVDRPVLWSTDHPYLYTLRTDIVVADRTVDTTTTTFGIRWFRFDPAGGFSLNGRPMKIQGVDLHHDQGALGSAINRDALVRQIKIMKSMGVNALRTSHNPPSPEMIDVCERLGIVMMVEAFDTWRRPKVAYDYGRFFDAHSDADIKEMVRAARNSPAVVLWSIGNEIPDSTSVPVGVPIAKRLIADVKSIDTSRPIVMGSNKYRSVPKAGSAQDRILGLLDGMGLNYNTAASVDALHARYPTKFFFESESSSETSTRGVYQDPEQLNTGENHTPGKRGTSSYDNNLAPWTMSGEYGLKKDRDRRFFAGQFLWSGIDYIGEPTPYDVFPVKSSFFGAVDTAGFPKDMYYLFRSQWTTRPMVHLLPMNWTGYAPGRPVQIWAYSNVDTVELFLNGRSLGVRRFDRKTTTYGTPYLETTQATGDDKTVRSGRHPGSYTSPNGSAGKLHLSWNVPFAPGRLVAKAMRDGKVVATDEVATASAPSALRLSPDRTVLAADGSSLSHLTTEVVDAHGVMVPDAGNLIRFTVTGSGRLAGLDNGRQEDAEGYQATTRAAFNGKALAIARSTRRPGPITVTATSPGLRPATVTLSATPAPATLAADLTATAPTAASSTAASSTAAVPATPANGPAAGTPLADASYSGAPGTLPAAMLDGDPSTGWSNHYDKAPTALLPAFSRAHASDWVSVSSPAPRMLGAVTACFTVDASHDLPAAISVTHWNGSAFVPVRNPRVTWAAASNRPTTITFDPVRTTQLKLDMTSRAPGTATGFLRITELRHRGAPQVTSSVRGSS